MTISVLLAHPGKESFNHAIARAVTETLTEIGRSVSMHDLYDECFEPLISGAEIPKGAPIGDLVRRHCEEIVAAEGIVVIHPNWWGQPPAILKGWIDRVLRPGLAYEFLPGDAGEGVPRGLLRASSALVFNTSNTLPERERDVFGDPLDTIWKNCVFGLCGVSRVCRNTYAPVITSTPEQRGEWLRDVRNTVKQHFSINEKSIDNLE